MALAKIISFSAKAILYSFLSPPAKAEGNLKGVNRYDNLKKNETTH